MMSSNGVAAKETASEFEFPMVMSEQIKVFGLFPFRHRHQIPLPLSTFDVCEILNKFFAKGFFEKLTRFKCIYGFT